MTERGSRPPTRPDDFVSLSQRLWALAAVRAVAYTAVVALLVVRPDAVRADTTDVLAMTLASALVTGATLFAGRLSRRRAVQLTAASLLADGAYLGWVVYATGGSGSSMWSVLFIHVISVTTLGSFQTGVKVTIWHSLVRLAVLFAEAAGLLAVFDPRGVVPRVGSPLPLAGLMQIVVVWAIFAVTAFASSVNEHELRGHRHRLEALSEMVRRFETAPSTTEIPGILLRSVASVFDIRRGAFLVERDDDVVVVAGDGLARVDAAPRGADRVMETAWGERRTILVRRLDAAADRRLASLFPGASNLALVPLAARHRGSAGVVVLERGGRAAGLRSSTVAMLEEFCAHAWLAVNNAWLVDDIRDALEENRALRDKLLEQNESLERIVEDRTAELSERLRQLRLVDDSRRALLDKLVTAQEEERARLAGDIHDDPIQKMVVTSMRLQLLRRQVNSDPEIATSLEQLLDTVHASIGSLRHLLFELRPTVLDEDGLAAALRALLDSLGGELAYDLDNQMRDEPEPDVRVILYRIAQEAIGNVRKHARADHVAVALGQRTGGFFVRVADDGVGFGASDVPQSAPGHLGLTSMRERAELAGGSCTVQSLPRSGTVVEAWVPAVPKAPSIGAAVSVVEQEGSERVSAEIRPLSSR